MKEAIDAGYSRLHITPFDPQLLNVIVPSAILPNARRISYHCLQTFPDKLYGFIDLPTADAAKIKTKLNGATLRGVKISIEPARPENMPAPSPDAMVAGDGAPKVKKPKSDKKRKRDNLKITGVELEDGRKVKRGWTVTSDEAQVKKKKAKEEDRKQGKPKTKDEAQKQKKRRHQEPESQYIDGPEALVKTRLPPNKIDDSTGGEKKKSKKGKNRDVVVHEFENNTKFATFLKTTKPAPATGREGASFVEGKGWVDKDGTVLEEVKSTKPTTVPKLQVATLAVHQKAPRTDDEEDDTTSSSGSSSEESESDEDSSAASPVAKQVKSKTDTAPSTTLSETAATGSDAARPKSSGSMQSLTIQIPPATPTPASKVHPLEALYKRQLPGETVGTQTPADPKPFTFGGGLDDDLDDDGDEGHFSAMVVDEDSHDRFQGSQIPMTPYSKQDFESRRTRSAAPTPDTAHPSRFSRLWPHDGDDDLADVQEDEQEDIEAELGSRREEAGSGDGDAGEDAIDPNTDFQKWFWKNRGNLDRSWRKRRREAAKAKRYRENKAKEDRAI